MLNCLLKWLNSSTPASRVWRFQFPLITCQYVMTIQLNKILQLGHLWNFSFLSSCFPDSLMKFSQLDCPTYFSYSCHPLPKLYWISWGLFRLFCWFVEELCMACMLILYKLSMKVLVWQITANSLLSRIFILMHSNTSVSPCMVCGFGGQLKKILIYP